MRQGGQPASRPALDLGGNAARGLLLSGGTDYHGDAHSVTPLGGNTKTIRVPSRLLQEIKQRLATIGEAKKSTNGHR